MGTARLHIRLLGSFQVSLGETAVTSFESHKVRALLAYLVVECNQAHSREKLAALFWPEMSDRRAHANLSRALYNLRQILHDYQAEPPFLLRSRDTVQFNPESDPWLDIAVFNTDLDEFKNPGVKFSHEDHSALEALQAAIELYRGGFLEELVFDSSQAFDEWVLITRQRLQRKALSGLHSLVKIYSERGDIAHALPYAYRQVAIDPLGEPTYRQLMALLAASGQRSQALDYFRHLQILLAEELNISPEAETLALVDRIRGEEFRSTREITGRDNLPAFLTPLIGRRQELAEIQARLADPAIRLMTILGPGGSGKTRLALEVARSRRETFRYGVCFVPLNPLQSPDSILPAIADALELPRGEGDDPRSQLTNYLRARSLLLVLDGFEHLLAGTGGLVELLRQAPELKILVTSRTRLNLKGEQIYRLSGMNYPPDNASAEEILAADAVQLLLSGLRRTRSSYKPAPEEVHYLLQVCRQVLGMPLGILLAASWGSTLGLAEIADMVTQSLDYLASDWTDVPARQRSLRATFDYTWSLLEVRERQVFQGLSVFRGTFTRQAAQRVSGATPHELRALVDRALLWNITPGWYEVHELLRQYGREQLAQDPSCEQEIGDHHSGHYLELLAGLEGDLKGAGQVAALDQIDLEHENFRAAWNWAASQGNAGRLAMGLEALCLYYELSLRYPDGEEACRMAIAGLEAEQVGVPAGLLQARLLAWQSRFTRLLGQVEASTRLIGKALLQLERTEAPEVEVHRAEAFVTYEHGNSHFHKNRTRAAACYRASLKHYQGLEDAWGTAKTLGRLGSLAYHVGSFTEAVGHYSECLALYRELGDPRGIAKALVELGNNTLRQGHVQRGLAYIEEATDIRQRIGDRAGVARNYLDLGRYCFYSGQFKRGNRMFLKVFPILEDLGMRSELVYSTIALSLGLAHAGEYTTAVSQALKGLPLAEEMDARREIGMAYLFLGIACLGQGDREQTQAWATKSIALYQEIGQRDELAWAASLLALFERGRAHVQTAEAYLRQTLEIGIETRGYFPVLCGMCAAALLGLDRGEIEDALELKTLVWNHPVAANSRWFEDVAGQEIEAAAQALAPGVAANARERGRARDLWQIAQELFAAYSEGDC